MDESSSFKLIIEDLPKIDLDEISFQTQLKEFLRQHFLEFQSKSPIELPFL
jgi:hypothetical protein